jgi:hypothetical protein
MRLDKRAKPPALKPPNVAVLTYHFRIVAVEIALPRPEADRVGVKDPFDWKSDDGESENNVSIKKPADDKGKSKVKEVPVAGPSTVPSVTYSPKRSFVGAGSPAKKLKTEKDDSEMVID